MTAGIGQRIGAALIDMAPLVFLAMAMSEPATRTSQLSLSLQGRSVQGWSLLWWLLASIAYYVVAELSTGTSPGKAALGLVVRDESTGPPSTRQILTRNAMRAIDILPFLYLIGLITTVVSPRNQRLGDLAARSMVAERSAGEPRATRTDVLTLAGVVAATIGIGIAVLALVDNSERVGDFDLDAQVVPYAEQVIADGFQPVSAQGLRLHLAPEVVSGQELDSILGAMEDLLGALTNDYEIVAYQLTEYPLPSGRSVESVDLFLRAEFEKRSGELILTISDIDGELRLIGFHFNA